MPCAIKVDRGYGPCYTVHMAQITIVDHVVYKDKSTTPVSVGLTADGCVVQWIETDTALTWEQMADVEYLSTQFEDVPVRAFKVIVGMLGKIYAYKDVYIATLGKE
jgi:hypothetical protein